MRKEDVMALLSEEMAAYERMRDELETNYLGKWVIVHDEELAGIYDTGGDAVDDAIRRFGRNPGHIRQVGERRVVSIPRFFTV